MTSSEYSLHHLIEKVQTDDPGGTVLQRLAEAQRRARTLADLGDALVGHFVSEARRDGASWGAVGEALGVSKQAAQQRSVLPGQERFTARCRHAVVLAHERARAHHHDYLGTEHLLLGVIADAGSVGARVLAVCAGSLSAVDGALRAALTVGQSVPQRTPLTERCLRAVERAFEAAEEDGRDYVGTEHLVLGVMAVPESVGARILRELDISYDGLRTEVGRQLRLLDGA